MTAAPARSLLSSLTQLRCSIFQTAYNPTSARSGAKYLRARLRGPSLASYYPPREQLSIGALNRTCRGFNLVDVDEVKRLIDIKEHKARGKGAPKKAKSKGACGSFFVFMVWILTMFYSGIETYTEEAVVLRSLRSFPPLRRYIHLICITQLMQIILFSRQTQL